ncbi:MAG TPA: matrixin family metalloprotease [Chthoniobacterales bacterium]|nr:matrixin family metalloprotease [Chthoniobacterales bacterium]
MWNQQVQRIALGGVVNASASVRSGDRVNSIVFSSTVFGKSFGSSTLAVTYYSYSTYITEADVLFNTAQRFDSYRGPLQFGSNRYAIADIRRVLVHELGHALGLDHPDQGGQSVAAIMNSMVSDRATLSADDIDGGQFLYGAPIVAPTPTPSPTPIPTPIPTSAATHLANISTRMLVGTGDQVLIGGFIVKGFVPKKVILRALGPTLAASGIIGALNDPSLELHNSSGAVVAFNDDWQSGTQVNEISASGVAPNNQFESAMIASLAPGNYTAIVRGDNNATGIGMFEAYELDSNNTRLVNISTRGRVGVADQALIGGIIVQGGTGKKVIIRAMGPSLASSIAGTLADPQLELRDASGNLIAANDNWATGNQAAAISATGVAPGNSLESAIVAALAPGNYTAIVRGAANQTGIGLVEFFDLDP